MINLFQFSSSQEYLYCPNTWLHKLTSYFKILIMFLYVLYLPFTSLFFLLLFNCYFIILSFTLLIPLLFFYHLYKQLLIICIILSMLCINLNETEHKDFMKMNYNLIISNNLDNHKLLNKIFKCNQKKFFEIYKITFHIQISLSVKIIRFFFIIISFLLIHKLLVITTSHKDVLFTYSIYFLYFFPFINRDIFFILILAEECIYLFEKRIKDIQMSIYLRGNKLCSANYHSKMINLYIIGSNILCTRILTDMQTISCSLYFREIFPQTQKIWLLR